MASEQQLVILYWQVAAAVLMGLEYLLPDKYREKLEQIVKAFFHRKQEKADQIIIEEINILKTKLKKITLYTVSTLIPIVIYFAPQDYLPPYGSLSRDLVKIVAEFLFLAGVIGGFNVFIESFVPLGIWSIFRTITTYLLKCPKGSIAGIGFICLSVSFYLRYQYIT